MNCIICKKDVLVKEKGDFIGRTTESINKFSENMKSMPTSSALAVGGSRKHKRFKNKTKKVRFNL